MSREEGADVAAADGTLTYRGRPIRAWVELLGDADDVANVPAAAAALIAVGMELVAALPALAPVLTRHSGAVRAQTAADLGRLGVRLLGVVPLFREALRRVVLTDGDEAVRTNALHALSLLGFTGISRVPALVEGLRDDLPAARAAAAQDLAQLGTEARESIPALISTCQYDPDLAVRVQAGAALWRVGRRILPSRRVLIEGLRSDDVLTCWTAADCLGDMGTEAVDAVPALVEALARQQFPLLRTSIVLALERIDPTAAAGVPIA
jgi:HEAT repeat protein